MVKKLLWLRLDENGVPLNSGEQIQIGGNDNYVSVCRKHFKSAESTKM